MPAQFSFSLDPPPRVHRLHYLSNLGNRRTITAYVPPTQPPTLPSSSPAWERDFWARRGAQG
jgi:hypothetical protein